MERQLLEWLHGQRQQVQRVRRTGGGRILTLTPAFMAGAARKGGNTIVINLAYYAHKEIEDTTNLPSNRKATIVGRACGR